MDQSAKPVQEHLSCGVVAIDEYYSSLTPSCGIEIFSRHLHTALAKFGIGFRETNLMTGISPARTAILLLHYTPSGFTCVDASNALIAFLVSIGSNQRLCVILHGVYARGETRFRDDGVSRAQERHIQLIIEKADTIVALSDSVARALHTWEGDSVCRRLVHLSHPGLFALEKRPSESNSYSFIGGVSRPKKNHASYRIRNLIDQCEHRGIRIWEHWTNASQLPLGLKSWRHTFGLLEDAQWSALVANASAVLCPYHTQIQPVSGIISEALSAKRFVLSTSFDAAVDFQRKFPNQIEVEDDLQRWPDILLRIRTPANHIASAAVPTWSRFAATVRRELVRLEGLGRQN